MYQHQQQGGYGQPLPPPQQQQQHQQQQYGYGMPPPAQAGQGGYGAPPPPAGPAFSGGPIGVGGGPAGGNPVQPGVAGQPGTTYQGYVKGLHGWNDPPPLIGNGSLSSKKKVDALDVAATLKSVENPVAHVLVALTTAMDAIKQKVIQDPIQRKVLEDTDKRLEELLERLGGQLVPDVIMAHLVVLSNDMQAASKTTMTLTLMSTEHHDEAHWIVGSKRLVELYTRVHQQDQQPGLQQQQFGGPQRY
ncbi:hypothetical protein BC830DRAFT_289621 [Chytriomyces sp. MP71]|nr:hypothetical protein BC830DRAFT_289621 [Chytriomyces sp. MP71]